MIASSSDLEEAIATANKIAAVIKAVGKFLGAVDKVLGKIKLV